MLFIVAVVFHFVFLQYQWQYLIRDVLVIYTHKNFKSILKWLCLCFYGTVLSCLFYLCLIFWEKFLYKFFNSLQIYLCYVCVRQNNDTPPKDIHTLTTATYCNDMIRLRTLQWGGYPGKPNLIAWVLKIGKPFPALVRKRDVIVEE